MTGAPRPVLIGIAGGSAAGKSTLAARLARVLAPRGVVIAQDRFYKRESRMPRFWSRRSRTWGPDYNVPAALDWPSMRRAVARTRKTRVVILEGLFALHDPVLLRRMALKLYVDCPEAVRLRRRLQRGVSGWTRARHLLFWRECVLPGHRRYVAPTRRFADVVVRG